MIISSRPGPKMAKHINNIADIFTKTVRQQGEKTAVIEAASGRQVSFATLLKRTDGYADYLTKQGVRPGDRVILMVTPSADFIGLTFGLFKIGVTLILIDPGMGYKNLLKCIEGIRPDIFIGIPKAFLFCSLFRKPFHSVRKKFCCGFSFGLFGPDIRAKANRETVEFRSYEPGCDDLAAIIFTTGSTGPPKGVRYEHSIFAAQLDRIRSYYKINHEHTDQPAFPLFGLFSAALGATVVIPDMDPTKPASVDPEKFVHSIEKYNVTYSFGSPAIWNVVSKYCVQKGIVLVSLKKVLMAGAPVPGDLLKRVVATLPQDACIYTPYGATESLPIVSIESREILESTIEESKKGKGTCVGRPLPGIHIKIIKIFDTVIPAIKEDMFVNPGEIGEIIVKGDVVTRAYENNEKETELAKIHDKDGFWHRMGDLGYLDEGGRLWFCGRKAHRVQTAKGLLYTIPCEAIINVHEDVYRSALVGVSSGKNDFMKPVLIVEPEASFSGDREKLLSEVQTLATSSEVTKDIKIFLIHDGFPVDIRHNAKIFREKLAVWAAEQLRSDQ